MKEYQDNKIRKKNKAFFILIFFRYQFRYFFRYQIFPIPVPILFSGTKFFRYRYRYFFPVPNFSDTGSGTFFRYQILPIPVPRLFSGTKFFRYRFRYHQKKWKIPGSGTGTHYKSSKFKIFGDKNQLRYQFFPIPVPRPFSGTKFFRYRFRDFFPVPNFSDTGSDTTNKMTNSRYQYVTLWCLYVPSPNILLKIWFILREGQIYIIRNGPN